MNYKRFSELMSQNAPRITLAGIEFFQEELEEMMENNTRYIIKGRHIYWLDVANYVTEPKFKVRKEWYHDGPLPLTKRGRYVVMDNEGVNHLIGRNVFAF